MKNSIPKTYSFVSEHTVEYIIVPKIVNHLKRHYKKVIPIYFWTSREGASIVRKEFENQSFKVVALYPRRPKIQISNSESIYFKFNSLLFERSQYLNNQNILTIAGMPLITSLSQVGSKCKCLWLQIKGFGDEQILSVQNGKINHELLGLEEIKINKVQDMVEKICKPILLDECCSVLRNMKYSSQFFLVFWVTYISLFIYYCKINLASDITVRFVRAKSVRLSRPGKTL